MHGIYNLTQAKARVSNNTSPTDRHISLLFAVYSNRSPVILFNICTTHLGIFTNTTLCRITQILCKGGKMSNELIVAITGFTVALFAGIKGLIEARSNNSNGNITVEEKIDNLDKHINNSPIPFRQELNEKLDEISVNIAHITKTQEFQGDTIQDIRLRVQKLEKGKDKNTV
jgi:hypothetical protein